MNFSFINQFFDNLFILKRISFLFLSFRFLSIRICLLMLLHWIFKRAHFLDKIGDARIMRFQGFEYKLKIILEMGLRDSNCHQILGGDFLEDCWLEQHQ